MCSIVYLINMKDKLKKFKNIDLHFVLMLIQGTTEKSRLEPEETTIPPTISSLEFISASSKSEPYIRIRIQNQKSETRTRVGSHI